MKKVLVSVLITAMLFAMGCQSGEKVEQGQMFLDKPIVTSINLNRQGKELFFPMVKMAPFKGFIAISDTSPTSGSSVNANLYCFDLTGGKIAWKKTVESGYHGRLEYSGLDDKVYVKLDSKLTCLDLFTGKTLWQSKENIDWIEKAVDGRVYCVGTEENRRNDDIYRTLMCFDAATVKNTWQVEVSGNFWSGYYGKDEICYFDWLEDGRNLIVRDAKTGVQKQKIQGADEIGLNADNQTNKLYRLWNDLFMHTPEKEISLYKFGRIDKKIPAMACVSSGKLLLQVKDDQTQILDLKSLKVLSTVPENIIQSKIIDGNAYFKSSGKLNVYENNSGKLSWFLGQIEDFSTDGILVPADDKMLRIHSVVDGSLISEIKLEDKIYQSTPIEGFGFVLSLKNGKVVFIRVK